jgi:ferrochelatase
MSKAVLLVNLGSPDAPSVGAVRRYLNEFLMDGRVIDVAWPWRRLIVGLILLKRPRESARAYAKIWTREGSPLVVTSQRLQARLQARLPVPVELAMRYQHPSIPAAMRRLAARGAREVLLIPLFPHYAMSSFETAVVRVRAVAAQMTPAPRVVVQPPCFDDPDYLAALAASAQPHLSGGYDHLLFSFHGLPERHLYKADPTGGNCLRVSDCCTAPSPAHATCYRAQCFKTVAGVVRLAGIPPEKYSVTFQSRLGNDPWLKPYTDFELQALPKRGVKKLLVICPAFVADCLETLEEIGLRGRATFLQAGGREFAQIPCLNEQPRWIEALEKMCGRFLQASAPV